MLDIKVEIKIGTDCAKALSPPAFLSLSKGDSVLMIKYTATVPAGTAPDIKTTRLSWQVDGADVQTKDLTGNGGDIDFTVAEGSSGSVFAQYIDGSGNVSNASPSARFENASDQTPPGAPAGAPLLSKGDTVA